jgi:hypothetical protein
VLVGGSWTSGVFTRRRPALDDLILNNNLVLDDRTLAGQTDLCDSTPKPIAAL